MYSKSACWGEWEWATQADMARLQSLEDGSKLVKQHEKNMMLKLALEARKAI